jgi:hypothetical protein
MGIPGIVLVAREDVVLGVESIETFFRADP